MLIGCEKGGGGWWWMLNGFDQEDCVPVVSSWDGCAHSWNLNARNVDVLEEGDCTDKAASGSSLCSAGGSTCCCSPTGC